MDMQNEYKKNPSDLKKVDQKIGEEKHWIEIVEPYLKKMIEEEEGLDLVKVLKQIAGYLWNIKRQLLIINGIVIILLLVHALFFVNPYFESTVIILPDYGNQSPMGNLGGLAAMAGISLGESSNTTDIFKSLLSSEVILEPVINAKYFSEKYSDSVNLIEYFELKPDSKTKRQLQKRKLFIETYKLLVGLTTITIDSKTNILSITVRMPEPQISSDVVNNIVRTLDEYVRLERKSKATIQISYLQERVEQIKDSLNIAENALKDFLVNNRNVTQSTVLGLEQSRLSRQVQIYQTVYIELTRQLEIARVDEIRDMPIVNVQEWSRVPVIKAGPKRINFILAVSVISFILSAIGVYSYPKVKRYFNKTPTIKESVK